MPFTSPSSVPPVHAAARRAALALALVAVAHPAAAGRSLFGKVKDAFRKRGRPTVFVPGPPLPPPPPPPPEVRPDPWLSDLPPFYAYARKDGVLLWCESGDRPDDLAELACRATALLGATDAGVTRRDDPERIAHLARSEQWPALLDEHGPAIGPDAQATLETAMAEAGMGPLPAHVETDGAMAICNRCGSWWIPRAHEEAGRPTWRLLRFFLAEFIQEHRPCGVVRRDGRVGIAAHEPFFPEQPLAPPRDQIAAAPGPPAAPRVR